MAVYKVPQDVEADDKLIGPFSFRQFIYLIIVAISMAAAWGFSQIFIPLAIIPLPIILFFAVLALPLRKDQPMETYLSAVVSFYFLKSRVRFWQPDGIASFITIIPPKDADKILTKNLDEAEATQRLGYLADLVDTHGWAIRGAGVATADTSISTDLYYESQRAPDMMDDTTPAAQAMTQQLDNKAAGQRQEAITGMQTAAKQTPIIPATPVAAPLPLAVAQTPQVVAPAPDSAVATPSVADPPILPVMPSEPLQPPAAITPVGSTPAMDTVATVAQQHTIDKTNDAIAFATALANQAANPATKTALSTSVSTPDTGTMELTEKQADELSQQADVTVATLAQQAERVAKQNKVMHNGDEVTISFR